MEFKLCKLISIIYVISIILPSTEEAKILFIPVTYIKNSALRNVEKIARILAEEGHQVYVLGNDRYNIPPFLKTLNVTLITFPRPVDTIFQDNMDLKWPLAEVQEARREMKWSMFTVFVQFCEALLSSTKTMDQLKSEHFQLVITDSLELCGRAIVSFLHVPHIEFLSFDIFWRMEKKEVPLPLSYSPLVLFPTTANMTFLQRTQNVVVYILAAPMHVYWHWVIHKVAQRNGIEMTQVDSLGFVFGGFPLEDPLPTMPDMVHLNGFLVSQPKPLPQSLEDFVQSSGDDGILIVSFGSMVSSYDDHYGNLFAEAFAQFPQKVIWKYEGPIPSKLGDNTRITKWLPQTDLLSHPKMKVFITHCGLNSFYETVYYGVPVVAIPLYGDQLGNAAKLAHYHEIGVELDLQSLTVQTLVTSVQDVINNPKYKRNAMKLATQLRDKPISSRKLMLYWVDYILRHKTVSHLKPYGRFLTWYQFYLLDVSAFLLAVSVFIIFLLSCCCRLTWRWGTKKMRKIVKTKSE